MTIITVTSNADSGAGSLRQAIADAQNTDTIVFDPSLSGQTITLATSLSLDKGLTIDGTGANITISGGNAVTDFVVSNASAVKATLRNLTIADGNGVGTAGVGNVIETTDGGNAAGGVYAVLGKLSLEGDRFVNDTATGGTGGNYYSIYGSSGTGGTGGDAAGAVFVESGATVTASNLTFTNDTANGGAGGRIIGGPNNGQTGTPGTGYSNANSDTVNDGGTTTPCYVTGTSILTVRGDVAVEDLRVGDRVVTAAGAIRPIRWIGHRAYAGRFANANPDVLPICFKAGSLDEGVPARDLWVSPKHAMFLDGALFPAEVLVNGVSVVKAERIDSVTYWHIELDSHDVLLAEGAPAESFVDDHNRGIFHNAQTFAEMYPEVATPVVAIYCAQRYEDGHQLEAVRQALAARAGIASRPACGALHGYVDAMDGAVVRGWARSALNPAMPVCLDLVVDGRVVAQALANRPRADLDAAGYGAHAFEIELPAGIDARSIAVRRSADGTRLKMVLDRVA